MFVIHVWKRGPHSCVKVEGAQVHLAEIRVWGRGMFSCRACDDTSTIAISHEGLIFFGESVALNDFVVYDDSGEFATAKTVRRQEEAERWKAKGAVLDIHVWLWG